MFMFKGLVGCNLMFYDLVVETQRKILFIQSGCVPPFRSLVLSPINIIMHRNRSTTQTSGGYMNVYTLPMGKLGPCGGILFVQMGKIHMKIPNKKLVNLTLHGTLTYKDLGNDLGLAAYGFKI